MKNQIEKTCNYWRSLLVQLPPSDGSDAMPTFRTTYDTLTLAQQNYLRECMLSFGRECARRGYQYGHGRPPTLEQESEIVERTVCSFEPP